MTDTCPPVNIDLSWSKLKNYEQCHQRTKLLMEKKRSKHINGRTFLPGTLADRCMRLWLEEGKFESGGMHKFLEEQWVEHTGKESEYVIEWKNNPKQDQREVLDKVRRSLDALEPILMKKVVPYPFKPEFRFKSVIGIPDLDGGVTNISILGAVDVAVKFGTDDEGFGQYGLYDLKITEGEAYIKSTLAQLTFYDLAFWGHTGVKPIDHAFWAPLLPEKEIQTVVTDDERTQMLSRIVDYCHGVWSGNWQLTKDKQQCWGCPVKHACPRYVNPITVDQQGKNRASFDRPKFEEMPDD